MILYMSLDIDEEKIKKDCPEQWLYLKYNSNM